MFSKRKKETTQLKRNTGVQRKGVVQTKIKVGDPNDKYEHEADAMADKVMSMPSPKNSPLEGGESIQQKCTTCEQEEAQTKPLASLITPLVQRQSLEEEDMSSEALAKEEAVQSKPIQRMEDAKERDEELATKPIQRMTEDEELDTKPIQRMEGASSVASTKEGREVGSSLESQLNASKGGGNPLPAETNEFMSSRFGTDFSNVKVHTDSNAVQMNKELNSQAFAHGNHIYFNQGKYDTNSSSGKHLLAHELTHTVQQGKNLLSPKKIFTKKKKGESWKHYAIRMNKALGHKATEGLLNRLYRISGNKKYYNRALKDKGRITYNFVLLVLSAQKVLFPLKKERKERDGILGDQTIRRGMKVLNAGFSFMKLWNAIKKFFKEIGTTITGWWNSFTEWLSGDSKKSSQEKALQKISLSKVRSILTDLRKDRNYKKAPFMKKRYKDKGYSDSEVEEKMRWTDLNRSGAWCASGVSRIFKAITGLSQRGNGKDWTGVMRNLINKNKIQYIESNNSIHKSTPPNHSVLVWNYEPYGHVAIVVGGKWFSDFESQPGRQLRGGRLPDAVFIPR